jgi:hypothetical protein
MANFIKTLQAENAEMKAKIEAMEHAMNLFRSHLCSSKFQGFEADGSRRDWIAVNDVFRWIETIREAESDILEIAA